MRMHGCMHACVCVCVCDLHACVHVCVCVCMQSMVVAVNRPGIRLLSVVLIHFESR